jgi:hypothetical protein
MTGILIGQAMAQVPVGSTGDLQILYVPRRHPINRDLKRDQSSLAGKYHQSTERIEMDVTAAYHFEDIVIGIGTTGTVRYYTCVLFDHVVITSWAWNAKNNTMGKMLIVATNRHI